MDLDHVLLSRLGFALTASYHIIFPCLIIGLAFFLAALEIMWLRTGRLLYRIHYDYWLNVFATAFVIAIITGVGLSFQLDTHFGNFYRKTLDILLPIRHLELVNTIVLEAGSLGIMLWGWNRVGNRLHLSATLLMTVGVVIAGVCIIARNSWMQTPDGHALEAGQLVLRDWMAAIITPSFPYRFFHMMVAAFLSTACFVLGISAWFLIKRRHREFAQLSLKASLVTLAILGCLQPIIGHLHGLNTKEYQPAKIAAIEGLWESQSGAPLVLFALPDQEQEKNRWSLEIPKLSSLVLTHDLNGPIKGIKETDKRDRPNVPIVFFSFRIMVGLGLVIVLVGVFGCLMLYNGRLYRSKLFLVGCVSMMPIGFLATIAGWIVSEVGRQPWVIYGIVRTSDMVRPLSAAAVEHSLLLMGGVYAITLVAFSYLIGRFIKRGPSSGYAPGFKGSRFASPSAGTSRGLLREQPSNEGLIHDESS